MARRASEDLSVAAAKERASIIEKQTSGPPFVRHKTPQNTLVLYKLYTPKAKSESRHTPSTFIDLAIILTLAALLRIKAARSKFDPIHKVARTWERRCMDLMGRQMPPYIPTAMERLIHGKRGKYWGEKFDSPWKKMEHEHDSKKAANASSRLI